MLTLSSVIVALSLTASAAGLGALAQLDETLAETSYAWRGARASQGRVLWLTVDEPTRSAWSADPRTGRQALLANAQRASAAAVVFVVKAPMHW